MKKLGLLSTRGYRVNIRSANVSNANVVDVLTANTCYFAEWEVDNNSVPWVYFSTLSNEGSIKSGWVHTDYVNLVYVQDSQDIQNSNNEVDVYVDFPLPTYPTIKLTKASANIVGDVLEYVARIIRETEEHDENSVRLDQAMQLLSLSFKLGSLKKVYNEDVSS